MADYNSFYKTGNINTVPLEQLLQLLRIIWDGDLISKSDRDTLVKMGYATRANGFQIITGEGITYLVESGIIRA